MKRVSIIIACLMAVLGAAVIASSFSGSRPFKNLKAGDIESAQVRLLPPDRTVRPEDTDELARLLNAIVIYDEDDSFGEYDGGMVILTLSMTDGSKLEVMENNSFVVINGKGYKAKYAPCERLTAYAYGLMIL